MVHIGRQYPYVFCVMLAFCLLSGCSGKEETYEEPVEPAAFIEDTDTYTADIFVYESGYEPDERKIFYVTGECKSGSFWVKNSKTGDKVFTGELKNIGSLGKEVLCGEFTSLSATGKYEIIIDDPYTDKSIDIKKGVKDENYLALTDKLKSLESDDDVSNYYRISVMLLASEMHDDYVDWAYINKSMKEALNKEISLIDTSGMWDHISDRLLASAVFADYYCVYGDIEPNEVDGYLDASIRIYDSCMEYADRADPLALYMADASLNRATGQNRYRKGAEEYDRDCSHDEKYLDFAFIADMIYLRSRNISDHDRCNQIVSEYLNEAYSTAKEADTNPFYVSTDVIDNRMDAGFAHLMACAFADYILSGDEYLQTRTDHMHYLYGFNPDMKDLMPGYDKDIKTLSKLVFVTGSEGVDNTKPEEKQ